MKGQSFMELSPHVNELVALLARGGENELSILRTTYPHLGGLLDGGLILGESTPGELAAYKDIATVALHKAVSLSSERIPLLRTHLRNTSQIDLGGQLIGTLGSGSALGALLLSLGEKDVASICAGLALIGSVVALWAKYRLRDISGNEGGLTKAYLALRESYWQAQELLARLEHPLLAPTTSASLIEQANTLARSLNLLLDEAH